MKLAMKSPGHSVASRCLAICLLLVAVALSEGCSSSRGKRPPKTGPAYTYVIRVDDSLAAAEFSVDVVPVNPTTAPGVKEGSVSEYFKPGSDSRPSSSAVISRLVFRSGSREQTVPLGLPERSKYRFPGYSHIAILADIPAGFSGGKDDARRILLPLDPAKWPRRWDGKKNTITVTISRGGVVADPGWIQ